MGPPECELHGNVDDRPDQMVDQNLGNTAAGDQLPWSTAIFQGDDFFRRSQSNTPVHIDSLQLQRRTGDAHMYEVRYSLCLGGVPCPFRMEPVRLGTGPAGNDVRNTIRYIETAIPNRVTPLVDDGVGVEDQIDTA